MCGTSVQDRQHLEQAIAGLSPSVQFVQGQLMAAADVLQQPIGDPFRGQHEVDHLRPDRAERHSRVLRRLRVLRDRDAEGALHFDDAQGAVRAGAGQQHGDGLFPCVLGERTEEVVDGKAWIPIIAILDLDLTAPHAQAAAGWRDVDMVGQDHASVAGQRDRDAGFCASSSGNKLGRPGCRWVTTTNAMPESGATAEKNFSSAFKPPAEAPMPTTG